MGSRTITSVSLSDADIQTLERMKAKHGLSASNVLRMALNQLAGDDAAKEEQSASRNPKRATLLQTIEALESVFHGYEIVSYNPTSYKGRSLVVTLKRGDSVYDYNVTQALVLLEKDHSLIVSESMVCRAMNYLASLNTPYEPYVTDSEKVA